MKTIGISSCFLYPDKSRTVFGPKTLSYVESDMFTYIAQSGVLPVLIPNLPDDKLQEIIDECDGFIFQGGTDMSPGTYGEEPIVAGKWLGDSVRDEYELRLMKLAMASDKPIFGICRGMQLLNVFCGGTLYQDLESQMPGVLVHRDANAYDTIFHNISWEKQSFLSEAFLGIETPKVNSVHHQSVKVLGSDLEILAISSSDGIVEACEMRGSEGKVFAVQWHPEFSHTLDDQVLSGKPLMDHFLEQIEENS